MIPRKTDAAMHDTDPSNRELTRPVTCIRELFVEPPARKVFEPGDSASPDWIDVTDTKRLLKEARRAILSRLAAIENSSMARMQESAIEDLFYRLRTLTKKTSNKTQFGLALMNLLNSMSGLLHLTSIAVSDEERNFHVWMMREAAKEGRFTITAEDLNQTFVAAKGRRPNRSNRSLYEEFDNIKKRVLEEESVMLSDRAAVEAYEKEIGRRLPFSKRDRVIVSYQTRNRRQSKG